MYGVSPNLFWETSSEVSDMMCNWKPLKPPYILVGDTIYIPAYDYPLSYGVPVRERYGSTLLPATREQHNQNCTQSH